MLESRDLSTYKIGKYRKAMIEACTDNEVIETAERIAYLRSRGLPTHEDESKFNSQLSIMFHAIRKLNQLY